MTTAPDWESLRGQARDAMSRAYAPYSRYPVGAAALVDDGRTITGCNVENASYGLSLCAECGLISELFAGRADSTGPAPRLTAFTCVDHAGDLLVPCGRCRQLLHEHGGPDLLVDTAAGIRPLSELLPDAFGAGHLKG
ncbi:cytidine deaminase [Streptomyces sioyaensis]|uniref:cytidine deaminase n=1 Tax=Streptomyces sioyaensis TaxID=67364 RepID=UPI0036ED9844